MDGILNIYKEKDFTSHDVVAKLRGILHMRKIGHTGTLDPQATGVLPVCLGRATKACDMMTEKSKVYEAVLLLGVTTDTEDMTGQILTQQDVTCTEEQVREAVESFLGTYEQIPPMYSALKVGGKKLYELAREGKTIERKARPVTLYELKILKIDLPRVSIAITCSKGTYIRSLCRDIGEKLGCGGCMEELIRTRVGHFQIENALTLSQVEALMKQDRILEVIEPTDRVFAACPAVYAGEQDRKLVHNGNPVSEAGLALDDSMKKPGQWLRLYDDQEEFIGIYQYDAGKKRIKPVKMFLA
jgi:tRNA pseudouridine55 synthase